MFFVALFLGSQPEYQPWQTPGYITLFRIVWFKNFWYQFGSALLVFTISNSLDLQKLFTNPLAQYLGKLSYALYLVHYVVVHVVGFAAIQAFRGLLGAENSLLRYEVAFILGLMVAAMIAICAADIVWRAVDVPCVKFGKWLEEKCLIPGQK